MPRKKLVDKAKIKSSEKCAKCKEIKSSAKFYISNSPIHSGLVPTCKECISEIFENNLKDGMTYRESTINICELMDRTFIEEVFKLTYDTNKDSKGFLGIYLKNSQMAQYVKRGCLRFKDSEFDQTEQRMDIIRNCDNGSDIIPDKNVKVKSLDMFDFQVDDEVIDKWGFGYKKEEYFYFEKKYKFLENNYQSKTNMHEEALVTYIRYRVKEEMATARGDVKEAKEWGQLAKQAATDAKINPSQLSKADLSDGLSTFSELSQAVEREVDIIPILPRFKFRPNDALDFNIWCYVNYIRDMSGLPPCKYEDIYNFYDRRKEEYVEQYGDPYGIFKDEPTESNRENIKKFINEENGGE